MGRSETPSTDCPVCGKRFYGKNNFLLCNGCKLPVHASCAGIKTPEEYDLVLNTYKCTICSKRISTSGNLPTGGKDAGQNGIPGPKSNTHKSDLQSVSELSGVVTTNNADLSEPISIIVGKIDLLTTEVIGLKQLVQILSGENKQLREMVDKLLSKQVSVPTTASSSVVTQAAHHVPKAPLFTEVLGQENMTHPVSHFKSKQNNSNFSSPAARGGRSSETQETVAVADDDGFTEVVGRRRANNNKQNSTPQLKTSLRPPRPVPLIGENKSSSLKTVPVVPRQRKKSLFVSRFDPSVMESEIEEHLKSALPPLGDVKVTRLATKLEHYSSFHIEVAENDFPLVNNSTIWPSGVLVKEFFGRLTPEKCFKITPSDVNTSKSPIKNNHDAASSK